MNISISRESLLQRGALGTGLVVALVLLCVFYSIVAGAVDRAAQRRASLLGEASVSPAHAKSRAVVAAESNRTSSRAPAFGTRTVSYLRPGR